MTDNAFGYDIRLPDDIREIFMWLCQDVASLSKKWGFYQELFGSEETTRLLSDLARASFQIIEESLRADMTMGICRLSDPPQSVGKDNLSILTLVYQLGEISDISILVNEFREACEPLRQYRNKRVGHNDLYTTIKFQDNPLPGIGRRHIDRIVQLAERILNTIYQHFVDGELFFQPVLIGGANTLIFRLKMAKEYETKERNAVLGNAV
jgi:hypothetical protein